jgi:hypothetical protein
VHNHCPVWNTSMVLDGGLQGIDQVLALIANLTRMSKHPTRAAVLREIVRPVEQLISPHHA